MGVQSPGRQQPVPLFSIFGLNTGLPLIRALTVDGVGRAQPSMRLAGPSAGTLGLDGRLSADGGEDIAFPLEKTSCTPGTVHGSPAAADWSGIEEPSTYAHTAFGGRSGASGKLRHHKSMRVILPFWRWSRWQTLTRANDSALERSTQINKGMSTTVAVG